MRISAKILLVIYFFAYIFILTGCATGQISSSGLSQAKGKISFESVCEEILATPEEKIDIGRYALLLTKAVYPEVDIKYALIKLDEMADGIRPHLKGVTDPQKIVDILNNYFFEELGFQGLGFGDDKDRRHFMLHYALLSKQAHCVTIGIIYLCLAERLDLPIFGVHTHNHFFVRYDDGKSHINIDTTYERGKNIPDEEYLRKFVLLNKEISKETRNRLLRNMTKKEAIAEYILNALITSFLRESKDDYETALKYIDYAIKLYSDAYDGYGKKGAILSFIGAEKKDINITKEGLNYLLKSYEIYPYYCETIGIIAVTYYDLGDYDNCLKRIREIFDTFPYDEISKIRDGDEIPWLKDLKRRCEEKLGKSSNGISDTPKIGIK